MSLPPMFWTTTHLTPHQAISDAAQRMVQALDDNSSELLSSSLTPTATYDLRPFSFLDPSFTLLRGRETITTTLLATVGNMDTTHMLSNFRTWIGEGGRGKMTCYALAQHWRPSEGKKWISRMTDIGGEVELGDRDRSFLMGNRYDGELVWDAEEGLWKFESFVIRCVWCRGDYGVFEEATRKAETV